MSVVVVAAVVTVVAMSRRLKKARPRLVPWKPALPKPLCRPWPRLP